MDGETIRRLLDAVAAGERSAAEVAARLTEGVFAGGAGFAELGFAKVDTHRPLRTGEPEVVYGAGKSVEQILAITARLHQVHPEQPILVTRASDDTRAALRSRFGTVTEDATASIAAVGPLPEPVRGTVAVLCAGTSDLPVAGEATFTARAHGLEVVEVTDVGVAGLHRLLAARETLAAADCVIVVAGMDGALPSVVGGLVSVPLIAVPTSVGYGAAFGGIAPLLTMLNSCAPGVSVVNIDNGFGAAVCAVRIVRAVRLKLLRRRKQSGAAVRAVRRGAVRSTAVCAVRIVRAVRLSPGRMKGTKGAPHGRGFDATTSLGAQCLVRDAGRSGRSTGTLRSGLRDRVPVRLGSGTAPVRGARRDPRDDHGAAGPGFRVPGSAGGGRIDRGRSRDGRSRGDNSRVRGRVGGRRHR